MLLLHKCKIKHCLSFELLVHASEPLHTVVRVGLVSWVLLVTCVYSKKTKMTDIHSFVIMIFDLVKSKMSAVLVDVDP